MALKALITGETRAGRLHRRAMPGTGPSPAYEVFGCARRQRHAPAARSAHSRAAACAASFDVLLDEQLRPRLCEVNEAPNMGLEVNHCPGPGCARARRLRAPTCRPLTSRAALRCAGQTHPCKLAITC